MIKEECDCLVIEETLVAIEQIQSQSEMENEIFDVYRCMGLNYCPQCGRKFADVAADAEAKEEYDNALTFIPENDYGIGVAYCSPNAFVQLLRDNKNKPVVIQFLADMLES